ncbi:MAG: sigma-70 family RNA polymerase sigma factor [Planctomycetes bacterium]|nr:sigma-70 family RNA polymerase sigma factor [Planctomycetota bacterium]
MPATPEPEPFDEKDTRPRPVEDTTHADDLLLAREALGGSAFARKRFAERMRCVPRYLCVLNGRMGRPFHDHELEDLAQETLIEIWRRLDSYAGLASMPTWAYRFCQQVLSSRLRSRQRRPPSLELRDADPIPAPSRTSLDHEHVHNALDRLRQRDADIIRLKHFEQLTFEEIAARLGMPSSTAKADYQRALERLRELLGTWHKEGDGWTR